MVLGNKNNESHILWQDDCLVLHWQIKAWIWIQEYGYFWPTKLQKHPQTTLEETVTQHTLLYLLNMKISTML